VDFAVGLLTEALRDCPGDLAAWEAKGKLLQIGQRPAEAVAALEALLEHEPRHEGGLVTLGTILRDLGRKDEALTFWRRAVEVNPWVAEYQRNLVLLLADRDAWDEVRPHCLRWLELDPASTEARHVWVSYLLAKGRKQEAKVEYAKLRALRPPEREKLDAWFAERIR
jgi:tetratricopeptide (TPR) repeat protein